MTAQTARDKAEETPWPVALLQNGMDRAGEGEGLYPLAAFGVPSLGDSDAGWTSAAQGVRIPNADRQLPCASLSARRVVAQAMAHLRIPTQGKGSVVMVSDNVAVQHYNPQLHARRIKSTRMVLRWQDKSGAQFLVRCPLRNRSGPSDSEHRVGTGRDFSRRGSGPAQQAAQLSAQSAREVRDLVPFRLVDRRFPRLSAQGGRRRL